MEGSVVKVTTRKLSKEEMELVFSGQATMDEILASKQPIEHKASLRTLTTESYKYLKHLGWIDSRIRRKYKMSAGEFEQFLAGLNSWSRKTKQARDRANAKRVRVS